MMWRCAGLSRHKNYKELSQRGAHALCKAGSPKLATHLLEELTLLQVGGMLKLKVCLGVLTKIYANIPQVKKVNFDMPT